MNAWLRAMALALLASTACSLQGCFGLLAAGAGVTALVATDRRSAGTVLEDENLELKAARLARDTYGDKVHLDVTSFNRILLLTGEAPDAATRADLVRLALGVENVRTVQTEVDIGPPSSFNSRANDSYLSSKVRARLIGGKLSPTHLKVTTEAGVVYLMGLVKHTEADDAAEIASTTSGVLKVVKVFEYQD